MSEIAYRLAAVRKMYGERTVLNVPALTIERGSVFGLVGPSGAGKSTLLRLLGLIEAPTAGEIHLSLDGREITYGSASVSDRRQVVMVFQRPALLSRTLRDNVAYGLRLRGEKDARARIDAALERVALAGLAAAHPRTLSGGELQRVALARALVLEPAILLLDEPTANLDPANVRLIEDLIGEQHARRETTIVLVTHNVFQARRLATQVGLLLDGELVEVAPAAQFFDAPSDERARRFISGDLVY